MALVLGVGAGSGRRSAAIVLLELVGEKCHVRLLDGFAGDLMALADRVGFFTRFARAKFLLTANRKHLDAPRRLAPHLAEVIDFKVEDAETWSFVPKTLLDAAREAADRPESAFEEDDGVKTPGLVDVVVDVTGVGDALTGPMRAKVAGQGDLWHVRLVEGDQRREDRPERSITLGRGWAITRLRTLFQGGRIVLPTNDEAKTLAGELRTLDPRFPPTPMMRALLCAVQHDPAPLVVV